ncbi:hypothetical protein TWF696_006872 [Orbilia brochopaga]|uniref:Uncharacterized protein n=1 Tax=Orbilia brochopaga TaxID=3140254 RepID=A0AAV9UWE2_9PEZI
MGARAWEQPRTPGLTERVAIAAETSRTISRTRLSQATAWARRPMTDDGEEGRTAGAGWAAWVSQAASGGGKVPIHEEGQQ